MINDSSNKLFSNQTCDFTVEPLVESDLFENLLGSLSKIESATSFLRFMHFSGSSSTGKSRFAKLASKKMGWAYIDLKPLALLSSNMTFRAEDCIKFIGDVSVLIIDEYQYIDTNPLLLENFLNAIRNYDQLTLIACCQDYPVATVYSNVSKGMTEYLEVLFKKITEPPLLSLIDSTLKQKI